MAQYKCNHCGKTVKDRHPYYDEYCKYSPNDRHDFEQVGNMDFSNDTKWSESLVGKHWKLIIALIVIGFILQKLGFI